jgi:quinone-modifying oxidoreductase subunit QmoB
MRKIDDTLKGFNLETDRVQTYEVAITDIDRVPKLINDFEKRMFEIGMSPFKGF